MRDRELSKGHQKVIKGAGGHSPSAVPRNESGRSDGDMGGAGESGLRSPSAAPRNESGSSAAVPSVHVRATGWRVDLPRSEMPKPTAAEGSTWSQEIGGDQWDMMGAQLVEEEEISGRLWELSSSRR